MDLDELSRRFRLFAEIDCRGYSPLYERLGLGAASDAEVLGVLAAARPGQRRPVLLLAGVHHLLLTGAGGDLAAWYPTLGGQKVVADDPYPAFRRFCIAHADELLAVIQTRSTQTNEVARCAALLPALAAVGDEVGRPLALLELGASAGLNLLYDRYRYRYGDVEIGPPHGALTLDCELRGVTAPTAAPDIGWAQGVDLHPVDVADDDQARWLKACVFADQPARAERLMAAVAIARAHPPIVVRGDIRAGLPALAAGAPADHHLVVVHSWVLTYLPRDERPAFSASVAELGRRRDLDWISAETPGVVADLPHIAEPGAATVVGRQRWRSGAHIAEVVGHMHPHGAWLAAPRDAGS